VLSASRRANVCSSVSPLPARRTMRHVPELRRTCLLHRLRRTETLAGRMRGKTELVLWLSPLVILWCPYGFACSQQFLLPVPTNEADARTLLHIIVLLIRWLLHHATLSSLMPLATHRPTDLPDLEQGVGRLLHVLAERPDAAAASSFMGTTTGPSSEVVATSGRCPRRSGQFHKLDACPSLQAGRAGLRPLSLAKAREYYGFTPCAVCWPVHCHATPHYSATAGASRELRAMAAGCNCLPASF
jgi:hypothetical protein